MHAFTYRKVIIKMKSITLTDNLISKFLERTTFFNKTPNLKQSQIFDERLIKLIVCEKTELFKASSM